MRPALIDRVLQNLPREELEGALRLLAVYERAGAVHPHEAAQWRGRIAAWRIYQRWWQRCDWCREERDGDWPLPARRQARPRG